MADKMPTTKLHPSNSPRALASWCLKLLSEPVDVHYGVTMSLDVRSSADVGDYFIPTAIASAWLLPRFKKQLLSLRSRPLRLHFLQFVS